ncbi:MAG: aminoacyl-histidine dipeptidase [Bacteroidetes bacterium]|jgi:dipeptidase D|nr:aminoacyl-histidine dipeptidase [Bacteroidota bacterium]MBT3802785.1 aminoacyl-histidine dipeptidase [Bacteroidota bacterium]MBT3932724.1 aminoacyl-histidine dipeptidase [Bacteroidota bacterium]MBT4969869.1 aminoacyl-histidine dipeptidase [Bacteroidota bacterium]MBT5991317.1 aminoacyl-histidine dipeptidase [Bacteroidota bacterium]
MTSVLGHLEPKSVWKYFEEICKIPRPSKKEEKIIAYLVDFAKAQKLEYKTDDLNNVLISKPATKGFENRKTVVLQSHLDMVGEKNSDTKHDFEKDAILPRIDGELVYATGTTLGADDGIGIAAQMAILVADDIPHGPIECLFTVDEETGLTGAFGLQPGFFEAKTLINLDSEDWGEIFIGCAGGRDTKAEFTFTKYPVPCAMSFYRIAVTGLQGGHSGDEIHNGLGNSIKIVNRFILETREKYSVFVADINGGNARNAIPREAFATLLVNEKHAADFEDFVKIFNKNLRNELCVTAPDLKIEVEKTEKPEFIIDLTTQAKLSMAIAACPHGEQAWSQTLDNLVETSTNLATIKTEGDKVLIGTSQRSSIQSKLDDMVHTVQSVFKLAGAKVISSDGYPGWEPNPDSEIVRISEASYKRLFNSDPEVKAIHAGLECGLIGVKYPGIDMVSIGPDIKGAHTPEERINIQTTIDFWELLLDMLKNIPIR